MSNKFTVKFGNLAIDNDCRWATPETVSDYNMNNKGNLFHCLY